MSKRDATTRVRTFRPADIAGDGMPCVEVLAGPGEGRLIPLESGDNVIGRADSDPISFELDSVSRRHAKIVISRDGLATVCDLESTNGTFLNGARISRSALREGDRIQIGPEVALRFDLRALNEIYARQSKPPPAETQSDDAADAGMLTPRELEIGRLVADGRSNGEIGAALFISARTVGTHLTNMYKRLDIHSRAELTRYILEHNLLHK